MSTTKIIIHLIILLLTRLILGTCTILIQQKYFLRCNVNYLLLIYFTLLTTLFVAIVIIAFSEHKNLIINNLMLATLSIVYVTISMIVDVFDTATAIDINAGNNLNIPIDSISIVFATFIEHLIDIILVVIYINDWFSVGIILASITIACISITSRIFLFDRTIDDTEFQEI